MFRKTLIIGAVVGIQATSALAQTPAPYSDPCVVLDQKKILEIDQTKTSLKDIHPLDQKSHATCYGYAASLPLSVAMGLKEGERCSPIEMAVLESSITERDEVRWAHYNKYWSIPVSNLDFGYVDSAIQRVIEQGQCCLAGKFEDSVTHELIQFQKDSEELLIQRNKQGVQAAQDFLKKYPLLAKYTQAESFWNQKDSYFLETETGGLSVESQDIPRKLKPLWTKAQKEFSRRFRDRIIQQMRDEISSETSCRVKELYQKMDSCYSGEGTRKGPDFSDLEEFLCSTRQITEQTMFDAWKKWFNEQCPKKVSIPKDLKVVQLDIQDPNAFASHFDRFPEAPVVVFGRVRPYLSLNDSMHATHAFNIVGLKRSSSGQCLFRIRNSWGNQFPGKGDRMHSDWLRSRGWEFVASGEDSGDYWMPSGDLQSMIHAASTVVSGLGDGHSAR